MGTSDVLKALKLVQFKNFQNITVDHKSRNARESSHYLYLLHIQQNYFMRVSNVVLQSGHPDQNFSSSRNPNVFISVNPDPGHDVTARCPNFVVSYTNS